MQLPDNWQSFKSHVLNKVQTYCSTQIWPFDYDIFTNWLSNFDTQEDEYVALHLIDSLIVRSDVMARSAYFKLLSSSLRQHLIESSLIQDINPEAWLQFLSDGKYHNIRFLAVELPDEQAQSGQEVLRNIGQMIHPKLQRLIDYQNDSDLIIVLIDDFIGSGQQFIDDYANEISLTNLLKNNHVIYAPLMAMKKGITNIKQKFPSLILMPSEIIDESHNIFNTKQNNFRNDAENSVDDIKKHYIKMKEKYAPSMPSWLGRGGAGICVVFQWGCPNQTLSSLWMRDSQYNRNWHQLFGRRE